MTANARAGSSSDTLSLSPVALASRARELSPLITEQGIAGETQGRLTTACIDALRKAGLFSLFVPEALGGAELWPAQGIEIIEILSRADGSTGWVVMATQVAMATCGAYLPPAAAKTVFKNHIPLIAGQGAPVGRADTNENGYVLSGNWSYGSGLLHSEWIHTGAVVHRDGKPLLDARTQTPEARVFIVPIDKAEVKNNWDVLGLRSTGSVDYSIRGAAVPREYTHLLTTKRPHTGGDLYRIGIIGFAAIGHTGFALGIARRTLDEIAALATSASGRPTPVAGPGGGENFQVQYGRAEGQLRAARSFVFDVWEEIQRTLESGADPTVRQITLARLAFTNANSVATSIANFAFEFGGGAALRSGNIQRCFRDQRTASQHITASENVVRECAKDLLGLAQGKIWSLRGLIEP
jgi:alkylation response protein AidB-like acyl-CoA dehydrogenase